VPPRAPLVAGLASLALVVAVLMLALGGSGEDPPATGAASLVPADALAYVNLSIDPTRPAVRRALALARRLPDYASLSGSLARSVSGTVSGGSRPVDFARDVRPWLGREAAFAVLDTSASTAASLTVLDVSRPQRARAFVSGAGGAPDGRYDGVSLLRYPTGTEAAFLEHYLLLGQAAGVRAAIDVATGRGPSLAGSPAYQRAAAGEPADRVLDAYASAVGLRRVLLPRGGLLGALSVLLDEPALTGASVSISPQSGGARVRFHSALDPTLAQVTGFHPREFSPTLQNVVPAGSTLLLDVDGLDRIAPRILNAGAIAGIGRGIGPLLRRLGSALSAEGVDVHRVLSLFDGETAVALVPHAGTPVLVIVARIRDQSAASDELATLEGPLAQLFPPPSSGSGQVPELSDRSIGGVTAHRLALAPGLQIDYAVTGGLLVVSTGIDGIAAVAARTRALAADPAFGRVLGDRPSRVTSLLFLDFSQLLSLAERMGLTRGARLMALRPDLEKVRTVGMDSTSGEADTTAELYLQIS
jgi:Protein of unknown function (DUF3352)